ncbi:hypothetical protein ACFL4Y_04295 [Gemmatimonadota bacterium]
MYLPGDPDITTYSVNHSLGEYHPYKPVCVVTDSPYVFIAEQQDALIQVLDWELKPLYTIGRKGEGPDEFGVIASFDIRNDTLAVLDTWRFRVAFLTTKGEYISSFPIPFSAHWGFIDYTSSGHVQFTSYEQTSPFLVKNYTTDGTMTGGLFDSPFVTHGITMAQAFSVRAGDRIMALFIHQPVILIQGDWQGSWDYQSALSTGYPFLKRLFKTKRKLQEQGYGLSLYTFGKGFLLDDLLITPGPMYNLNVIDTQSGALRVINTGQLSRELGPWGYYTFDDLAIRGSTVIAVSSAASAVILMDLQEVLAATQDGDWFNPVIHPRSSATQDEPPT